MTIVGIFFILLYVMINCFVCFRMFVSMFGMKFIEFMAAGLFPSIFVAFCTDMANTKRQKNDYEFFYKDTSKILKLMCENLPTELYACIADFYLKENVSDDEWKKRRPFPCGVIYCLMKKAKIKYDIFVKRSEL